MPDSNFEQPSWQQEQERARQIMAQQEAEMEQTRIEAAQKKEAERQAAQEAAAAANLQQQREAERLTAAIILKQQAGEIEIPEGSSFSPTAEIDQKIAKLQKQTSTDYVMPYLFLTTGAAAVDVLQAVCDFSVVLSLLASGLGLGFSVARHFTLEYANPNAGKKERDDMLNRTLISGAISLIPFVNILPEQTGIMIHEWTIKRTAIQAASQELTKLKIQRQKMVQ